MEILESLGIIKGPDSKIKKKHQSNGRARTPLRNKPMGKSNFVHKKYHWIEKQCQLHVPILIMFVNW